MMVEKYSQEQNLRLAKAMLDQQGEINTLKKENMALLEALQQIIELAEDGLGDWSPVEFPYLPVEMQKYREIVDLAEAALEMEAVMEPKEYQFEFVAKMTEAQAEELLERIKAWVEDHGLEMGGGFRPWEDGDGEEYS